MENRNELGRAVSFQSQENWGFQSFVQRSAGDVKPQLTFIFVYTCSFAHSQLYNKREWEGFLDTVEVVENICAEGEFCRRKGRQLPKEQGYFKMVNQRYP